MDENATVGPGSPPAPRRRGFGTVLFWSLAGAVFLYAATLAAGGYLLHRGLSPFFDALLRRFVFTSPARGTFDRAGVDLFRAKFWLEGLSLPGRAGHPVFTAGEVGVKVPLLAGGGRGELSLILKDPLLRRDLGAAGAGGGLPAWAGPLLMEIPLREVSFSGGAVEVTLDPASPPLRVEGIDGLWRAVDGGGWSLAGVGSVPSDPQGRVEFKASFSGGRGELDLALRDLPWAYLAERLSSPGEDIRFLSGLVSLKTAITLRDGFITANPLVDLKDLRLEVPVERKKFAGFSVDKLKEVLEVDALSFTVPVNGRWDDPKVGFAVTLEQVLENALRQKVPDDRARAKLAKRGGWWLGRKADAAFQAWLSRRRDAGTDGSARK